MIAYRRDIDGLRSIAVLSVVLYHFGVPGFPGGYVGVDVFFVISGLLIGRSIIDDVRAKRFSYLNFYERRIRRLFPAAILVFAVTTIVACLLLLPPDLRSFGRSLMSAVPGLSNIAFYLERGYFDADAIRKPLLHTWSLSVEEQFYLFLPLIVGLFARWRSAIVPAMICIALVSLAASALMMPRDPEGVFYLLPYRAWELLIGVMVGQMGGTFLARSRRWRGTAAWAGLLLILLPVFLYSHDTPFPGLTAIPPVIGTALVLLTGLEGDTRVRRLLSMRLPVFIGLISYSLYLWHWPIVTSIDYYTAGTRPILWQALGLAASVGLAWASWRHVERPFRNREWIGRRGVFLFAGSGALVLMAAGALLYVSNGWPQRYGRDQAAIVGSASDFLQRSGTCPDGRTGVVTGTLCRMGAPDATPSFLVWGDSHLRSFQDGIDALARDKGRSGLFIWDGGCPPMFDTGKVESANTPAADQACRKQNGAMRQTVLDNPGLRDVVLIGRWSYYAQGHGTGRDAKNIIALVDAQGRVTRTPAEHAALLDRQLTATVDWLRAQGRRVFLVEQVPEIPESDARTAAIRIVTGQASREQVIARYGTVPRSEVEARQAATEALFARLAQQPGVQLLPTHDRLCTATSCSSWKDGRILLFDNNHLTVQGSRELRGVFAPVFETAPAD